MKEWWAAKPFKTKLIIAAFAVIILIGLAQSLG
nr:hypothetical protein [uncultured Gammaproteobacteria bacterium]